MIKKIFLLALLCASSTSHANAIVFDNFNQNYYYGNSGVIIGGPTDGSYFDEFAMSFTPEATGNVSEVIAAFYLWPDTIGDSFNLWLSADTSGLPSEPEVSVNFSVSSSSETLFGNDVIRITNMEPYLLEKDKTYWLGFQSNQEGVIGVWGQSNLTENTTLAERNTAISQEWELLPGSMRTAFSVSVTPVPLPASMWLFISGLLALVIKLK